jgi:beta-glucosidase
MDLHCIPHSNAWCGCTRMLCRDQEMPGWGGTGPAMGTSKLMARLANGTITKGEIAASAGRVLQTMFSVGLMDMPNGSFAPAKLQANVSTAASIASARSLCAASTVMLKNEQGLLPLKAGKKIAVIGMAQATDAIVAGGGSGSVHPSWHGVSAPLDAIKTHAGSSFTSFSDGGDINASATAAQQADVAIVFVGTFSGEGMDRQSLSLDAGRGTCGKKNPVRLCHQDALVAAIAAAQPHTVVVVATPGPVLLPWSGQVAAILTTFMCGEQIGNAVADILYGHVNPSARLPLTFPNMENETQLTPNQWPYTNKSDPNVSFTERGLFGYRYYDAHNLTFSSGFPFGHGLSFTTFHYSSLKVVPTTTATIATHSAANVSLTLTNNGTRAGAEIVQLYLTFPAAAGAPPQHLKGFQKVTLAAGAQTTVVLPLTARDLSIWDVDQHAWTVVKGTFGVAVGSSSRDHRLTATLTV